MKKLVHDLWQTNGRWDGAKIGAWGAGATIMAGQIHRVFVQWAAPDWIPFASAIVAVLGSIVGGHYFGRKADSKYPGDDK